MLLLDQLNVRFCHPASTKVRGNCMYQAMEPPSVGGGGPDLAVQISPGFPLPRPLPAPSLAFVNGMSVMAMPVLLA